jgi:hypothetical protein
MGLFTNDVTFTERSKAERPRMLLNRGNRIYGIQPLYSKENTNFRVFKTVKMSMQLFFDLEKVYFFKAASGS